MEPTPQTPESAATGSTPPSPNTPTGLNTAVFLRSAGTLLQIYKSPFLHACIPPVLILSFVGFGIWGHANNASLEIPLTLAIFLTGAGGGVLSTYFRLKTVEPKAITPTAILQIYMTPIISGVLGLVCYGMFLTGMLQGALFPQFTKGNDYKTFTDVFSIIPADSLSAAKSLLWAFVAGFSEKLIPNMLDKLAERATEKVGAPVDPPDTQAASASTK